MSLDELIQLLQEKQQIFEQILDINDSMREDVDRMHGSLREMDRMDTIMRSI